MFRFTSFKKCLEKKKKKLNSDKLTKNRTFDKKNSISSYRIYMHIFRTRTRKINSKDLKERRKEKLATPGIKGTAEAHRVFVTL